MTDKDKKTTAKDKKTTASKKETKSKPDSQSKSTAESKNTDSSDTPASEPKGYTIGERQKPVTDTYRASWDRIFRKR